MSVRDLFIWPASFVDLGQEGRGLAVVECFFRVQDVAMDVKCVGIQAGGKYLGDFRTVVDIRTQEVCEIAAVSEFFVVSIENPPEGV